MNKKEEQDLMKRWETHILENQKNGICNFCLEKIEKNTNHNCVSPKWIKK